MRRAKRDAKTPTPLYALVDLVHPQFQLREMDKQARRDRPAQKLDRTPF
ncbi:hypothetical protein [Maricaulis sp.]|nr:hypothetical protein [Maricaulis sp.]